MKLLSRARRLTALLLFQLSIGYGRFDDRLVGEFRHTSSDGLRKLQIAACGNIEFTEDEGGSLDKGV